MGKSSKVVYPHSGLTEKIIGSAFQVHNRIGPFFPEKIYENALAKELTSIGIAVVQQQRLSINFGGKPIGDFVVDLLVDNRVVVEVKAVRFAQKDHIDQLLSYLKASGFEVGLLLNFSRSVEIKRLIFSDWKKSP